MTWTHKNGQRCGWCIGGMHEHCAVAIQMGQKQPPIWRATRSPHIWRCECPQHFPAETHPTSRCMDCLRPGVDVDRGHHCQDRAECRAYVESFGTYEIPSPPHYLPGEDEEDEDAEYPLAV